MNRQQAIRKIQRVLGVTPDGIWGPITQSVLEQLIQGDPTRPSAAASVPTVAPRAVSAEGLDLIKHFEGLYLKAYRCPAGVWTIGYGHTGLQHNDGTVFAGRKITEAEADALLRYDLQQFGARVTALVKVPLQQHQFDALVSFDFNTGALHRSTLLRRVNEQEWRRAADEFLRWDQAGGRVLRGLVRRREAERRMFLGIRPFIAPR